MNTPSITLIVKWLCEWLVKHKVLLTIIWCLAVAAVSQFVTASEYNKFKLETEAFQQTTAAALVKSFKADETQDAKFELNQVREDIEDYKRFPEYEDKDWVNDRLKRLERREAVLEKKISS